MKILNNLNFNFNTLENSIKTSGTIIIVAILVILTINELINPSNFNL